MSDIFRKEYKELTDEAKAFISELKAKAEELYKILETDTSRELAVAKTKLEEVVFWATKHFTS